MSDDERELTNDEDAALRRAVNAWSADRPAGDIAPRTRLAQLREQMKLSGDAGAGEERSVRQMQPVSRWPAVAVAAVVALMLGLAIVWGRKPAGHGEVAEKPVAAPIRTVAEESDPPKNNEVKPAESVEHTDVKPSESPDQGADFISSLPLAKGAGVSVVNITGNVKISEIDGENVVVRAHKSVAGLGGLITSRGSTITINGSEITIDGKRVDPALNRGTDADALKQMSILVVRGADGSIQIKTVSKQAISTVSVAYDIGVPRYALLGNISTASGDIEVNGGCGDANLKTTTGAIRVQRTKGVITASSSNGDIAISDTTGVGNISATTGSVELRNVGSVAGASVSNGDIAISGAADVGKLSAITGNVRVQNAGKLAGISLSNGEIEISNAVIAGRLAAVTGGIHVKHCGGSISARVSNGDITIDGASTIGQLDAVTGAINADVKEFDASSSITSSNDRIRLRLAAGLDATLDVESTNGTITNSVPGLGRVAKNNSGTHETLHGKLGVGSSLVRIRATTGDVTLTPLP